MTIDQARFPLPYELHRPRCVKANGFREDASKRCARVAGEAGAASPPYVPYSPHLDILRPGHHHLGTERLPVYRARSAEGSEARILSLKEER